MADAKGPIGRTEQERVATAAYGLLLKFHRETYCGRPYHWAECEALVDAFGWESWEAWDQAVVLGRVWPANRV